MKKYIRLALITVFGIICMVLSTWTLYLFGAFLEGYGYHISRGNFLFAFLIFTGGSFQLTVYVARNEMRRITKFGSNISRELDMAAVGQKRTSASVFIQLVQSPTKSMRNE